MKLINLISQSNPTKLYHKIHAQKYLSIHISLKKLPNFFKPKLVFKYILKAQKVIEIFEYNIFKKNIF